MKKSRTNTDDGAVKKVFKKKDEEEKQRVVTFKIVPKNMNTDVEAPAIYVEAKEVGNAIEQAKRKTSLSRYPNWGFQYRRTAEIKHRR